MKKLAILGAIITLGCSPVEIERNETKESMIAAVQAKFMAEKWVKQHNLNATVSCNRPRMYSRFCDVVTNSYPPFTLYCDSYGCFVLDVE